MAVRSARPSSGEGRWPSAFPGGFPANRTTAFAGKPYFEVYLIESTSCIRYASGRSIKFVDCGLGFLQRVSGVGRRMRQERRRLIPRVMRVDPSATGNHREKPAGTN